MAEDQLGPQIRHSVASNLKGLLRFGGRQSTAQFWPYAGLVLVIGLFVTMAGFMGPFTDAIARMQTFAIAHPEQATVTVGPGSYEISIRGEAPRMFDARAALFGMAPGGVLVVVLLAAAVTRRLHDRGLPGIIGLLPVALAIAAGVKMVALFDRPAVAVKDTNLVLWAFGLNFAYIASLGLLLVLLCLHGPKGPNRYGPPPS